MAGEIGFDEGGVLDALGKPFFKKTITEYRRNRKGDLVEETTNDYSISMMHVVAALVLYYGPEILAMFKTGGIEVIKGVKNVDWPDFFGGDEDKDWAKALSAAGRKKLAEEGEVTVTRGGRTWVIKMKQDFTLPKTHKELMVEWQTKYMEYLSRGASVEEANAWVLANPMPKP